MCDLFTGCKPHQASVKRVCAGLHQSDSAFLRDEAGSIRGSIVIERIDKTMVLRSLPDVS